MFLQNSTFCASNTSNHSVEFQVAVSCYSGNNIAMGNSQPMTVYRESLTRFPAAVPHRSGTNEIKSLVQDTHHEGYCWYHYGGVIQSTFVYEVNSVQFF